MVTFFDIEAQNLNFNHIYYILLIFSVRSMNISEVETNMLRAQGLIPNTFTICKIAPPPHPPVYAPDINIIEGGTGVQRGERAA